MVTPEQKDEYTGDNLPLEIEERKDNIAEQYKEYIESLSRSELIEMLTMKQLREKIIDDDYMGEIDCGFEPK